MKLSRYTDVSGWGRIYRNHCYRIDNTMHVVPFSWRMCARGPNMIYPNAQQANRQRLQIAPYLCQAFHSIGPDHRESRSSTVPSTRELPTRNIWWLFQTKPRFSRRGKIGTLDRGFVWKSQLNFVKCPKWDLSCGRYSALSRPRVDPLLVTSK